TGLADAVLAGGRDLAPEVHRVGQVVHLGPVAGGGRGGPGLDRAEERDLVEPPEASRLGEGAVAQEAQVVHPPLHDRDREDAGEEAALPEERDGRGPFHEPFIPAPAERRSEGRRPYALARARLYCSSRAA